ncbi:MAG: type II secretion system F family protein [Acidocella sp.]|nr:type II secretion system F family protein [Acidocella sp.]
MSRKQKFETRISGATSDNQKQTIIMGDQISLAKVVSRTDLVKTQAANVIGVDLQQADAYPIKWWLVPPLSLGISWVVVWLATKSIGFTSVLYVLGWPIVWFIITKVMFIWFNNKRNSKLLSQFPDALGTIVRCVRVGIPIGEALRTVARDAPEPTKLEFDILADKVQIGIPVDAALRELSERVKVTEYQFFATAITLQMRSGGAITHTLETLADVIRKRVGLKARGFALTSEARTSSMILALLPFLTGTALYFMNRSYILLLFYTKSGQACLGGAILMLCIGLGIIQFMISNVLK